MLTNICLTNMMPNFRTLRKGRPYQKRITFFLNMQINLFYNMLISRKWSQVQILDTTPIIGHDSIFWKPSISRTAVHNLEFRPISGQHSNSWKLPHFSLDEQRQEKLFSRGNCSFSFSKTR